MATAMREMILESVGRQFVHVWGRPPDVLGIAPARINLIGEHTDYNQGWVMPMAIDRYTAVALSRQSERPGAIGLFSTLDHQVVWIDPNGEQGCPTNWSCYPFGVWDLFRRREGAVSGMLIAIDSNIPAGSGLSSSAALEVAMAVAIEAVIGARLPPVELAQLCQEAEHCYAGVPCGLMDQLSVRFAQKGHAMLIDCRSNVVRQVPWCNAQVAVLVIDSGVRHALGASEYPIRRDQCRQAATRLDVESLRDIDLQGLADHRDSLDPLLYRRARHVVSENERVLQAARALEAGQWPELGKLWLVSHESMRRDFEVTCPEIDLLVDLAAELGLAEGVYGARMTGGGFGGCVICLVDSSRANDIGREIENRYRAATGLPANSFVAHPVSGAEGVDFAS